MAAALTRLGVARDLVAHKTRAPQLLGGKVHAYGLKILIGDRDATLLLQTRKRRALLELQGVHRDVIGPQRHEGLKSSSGTAMRPCSSKRASGVPSSS